VTTQLVPINLIASLEKKVTLEWLSDDQLSVKDDFLRNARQFIQAELTPFFIDSLPRHINLQLFSVACKGE
jgi:hypothetical protein